MSTQSFQPTAYTRAPLRGSHSFLLPVSPAKAWELIGDHAKLPSYFPGVGAVTVDNSRAEVAGGKGCVRSCAVGEMSLTEDILLSLPGCALGYSVRDGNPMGLSSHFAAILLEDDGRGGTRVRWQQYFDHPQPEQITPQIFAMVGAAASHLTEIFLGR